MGKTINKVMVSMFLFAGPAYTISNENQRWATQVVPNVKTVLTVAGSGDQALFYKLAGVKIVDTFDITCNARAIQDIKCAAIKNLKHAEYKDLLIKLHRERKDVKLLPEIQFLWQFLPPETQEIIEINKSRGMFSFGIEANYYPENIPTETEYTKLKNILGEPFNFIWNDLESMSVNLTEKYDLINLSNIFDYIHNSQTQLMILNNLSKYLNKNGHIVCLPQEKRYSYKKVCLPNLAYERTEKDDKHTKVVVFQRIR